MYRAAATRLGAAAAAAAPSVTYARESVRTSRPVPARGPAHEELQKDGWVTFDSDGEDDLGITQQEVDDALNVCYQGLGLRGKAPGYLSDTESSEGSNSTITLQAADSLMLAADSQMLSVAGDDGERMSEFARMVSQMARDPVIQAAFFQNEEFRKFNSAVPLLTRPTMADVLTPALPPPEDTGMPPAYQPDGDAPGLEIHMPQGPGLIQALGEAAGKVARAAQGVLDVFFGTLKDAFDNFVALLEDDGATSAAHSAAAAAASQSAREEPLVRVLLTVDEGEAASPVRLTVLATRAQKLAAECSQDGPRVSPDAYASAGGLPYAPANQQAGEKKWMAVLAATVMVLCIVLLRRRGFSVQLARTAKTAAKAATVAFASAAAAR